MRARSERYDGIVNSWRLLGCSSTAYSTKQAIHVIVSLGLGSKRLDFRFGDR